MNNNKTTHLLIDGDITYHRAARRKHDDGSPVTFKEAVAYIEDHYSWLQDHLKADKLTVVLSGLSGDNFRKNLFPMYKGDRPSDRPEILDELKAYLVMNYTCRQEFMLEADDVLGILSTEPQDQENRIIVSIDKDLEQIPGLLFNPSKWENGVKTVSKQEGDLKFYTQWMTGDSTDCYPGIPGVGPKKAEQVIEEAKVHFEELQELVPLNKLLEEAILRLYARHQLTYDYAITQARLAKILRWDDYYPHGAINLWQPA